MPPAPSGLPARIPTMQLFKNATVAVADGEKFNILRNTGEEADLRLTPLAHDGVDDRC